MCLHSCVTTNKLNFGAFFTSEKKISQILESVARKWNTLDRNSLATVATWFKQRESVTLVKLNLTVHWIGLSLSFHLSCVLSPFVHGRLQNLKTTEANFGHDITPLNGFSDCCSCLRYHAVLL